MCSNDIQFITWHGGPITIGERGVEAPFPAGLLFDLECMYLHRRCKASSFHDKYWYNFERR